MMYGMSLSILYTSTVSYEILFFVSFCSKVPNTHTHTHARLVNTLLLINNVFTFSKKTEL